MEGQDKHQGYEWVRLRSKFGHDWILLEAVDSVKFKPRVMITWRDAGHEPTKLLGQGADDMLEYIKNVASKPPIPMDRDTPEADAWVEVDTQRGSDHLHLTAVRMIAIKGNDRPMVSVFWRDVSIETTHLNKDNALAVLALLDNEISRVYVAGDPTNVREAER